MYSIYIYIPRTCACIFQGIKLLRATHLLLEDKCLCGNLRPFLDVFQMLNILDATNIIFAFSSVAIHEFHETCHSVTFIVLVNSHQKMKANAEPRLLSSLVWIDSDVVVSLHLLESFFMKENVTEWQVVWNSWYIWQNVITGNK